VEDAPVRAGAEARPESRPWLTPIQPPTHLPRTSGPLFGGAEVVALIAGLVVLFGPLAAGALKSHIG